MARSPRCGWAPTPGWACDPEAFAHEPRWGTDRIFELEAVSGQTRWQVTHLVGGTTEITPKASGAAEPAPADPAQP